MSAVGPSRHFAACDDRIAFGVKRTSNGRQDRLTQSRMTRSGHDPGQIRGAQTVISFLAVRFISSRT
jgi:hypothetical protein